MNDYKIWVGVTAMIFLLCFSGFADMYKWVDENGVTRYSDTPPPSRAPKQSEVETLPTVQSEYVEPAPKPRNPSGKKSMEKAAEEPEKKEERARPRNAVNNSVELFSTSWCVYCKHARKFFVSKGIDYIEYDIEKDRSAARRFKKLNPRGGVPFVIINGQAISGFSAGMYESALLK